MLNMIYLKKINKCYTVLYNLCYFKDNALSENTGKRIGIEDESCPWPTYLPAYLPRLDSMRLNKHYCGRKLRNELIYIPVCLPAFLPAEIHSLDSMRLNIDYCGRKLRKELVYLPTCLPTYLPSNQAYLPTYQA